MQKIALAGGPGSGKTSLARHLVSELYNNLEYNAQHVVEFARDYINACNRHCSFGNFKPTFADQQMIFREQVHRERILSEDAVDFMITDAPIFLGFIYSFYSFIDPKNYQQLQQYLHLYEEWLFKYIDRYDYIFLLKREKPLLNDGTRGEDETTARAIDVRIKAFLDFHNIKYKEIGGSVQGRLEQILEIVL